MDLSSTIEKYATLGVIAADKLRYWLYYQANKKRKAREIEKIRNKELINVLFILYDLAKWKTEPLYQAMLSHPRFNPQICTTMMIGNNITVNTLIDNHKRLTDYLESKGYAYTPSFDFAPFDCDIVFYQEPYQSGFCEGFHVINHHKTICHISYAFNITKTPQPIVNEIVKNSMAYFVENDLVKDDYSRILGAKKDIFKVTGLPFSDTLLRPKEDFANPWKPQDRKKKRIIWAPHFTFEEGLSWLNLSSFMKMNEYMPKLAEKYKENVQFAFKPHPALYARLVRTWGKEKTDAYYDLWRDMENTQLEQGEYVGLFKYSDGMIHDCSSFTVEYMYADRPVITFVNKDEAMRTMNRSALKAYECSLHGSNEDDVIAFIEKVIAGEDPMREKRHAVLQSYFIPPHGKSACQNIINAILGE